MKGRSRAVKSRARLAQCCFSLGLRVAGIGKFRLQGCRQAAELAFTAGTTLHTHEVSHVAFQELREWVSQHDRWLPSVPTGSSTTTFDDLKTIHYHARGIGGSGSLSQPSCRSLDVQKQYSQIDKHRNTIIYRAASLRH